MPHESTVEHEQPITNYGPLENARRSTVRDGASQNHRTLTEEHECDEEECGECSLIRTT